MYNGPWILNQLGAMTLLWFLLSTATLMTCRKTAETPILTPTRLCLKRLAVCRVMCCVRDASPCLAYTLSTAELSELASVAPPSDQELSSSTQMNPTNKQRNLCKLLTILQNKSRLHHTINQLHLSYACCCCCWQEARKICVTGCTISDRHR